MPEREDRQLQQRAAGEQVEQAVEPLLPLTLRRCSAGRPGRTTPGRRDERAEPEQRDDGQREQQLLAQVRRPERPSEGGEHVFLLRTAHRWVGATWCSAPIAIRDVSDSNSPDDGRQRTSTVPGAPAATAARVRDCAAVYSSVTEPPAAAIFSFAEARERVRGDLQLHAAEVAGAEHLDRLALADRALGHQLVDGRPRRPRGTARPSRSRLTTWYSTLERVLEALQLRQPHVQRHLPALEARPGPGSGPWCPWCRDRRSCPWSPHRDPRGSWRSWHPGPGAGGGP